jgi:hypothetical protein
MTAHLTPGSGRKDSGYLGPRFGSDDPLTCLGVREGESNPARMLSAVLILVFVAVVVGLMMAWWLI